MKRLRDALRILLITALLVPVAGPDSVRAATPCDPPVTNPVACENTKPGNPATEWDLPNKDAGDSSIQGYATDISFNKGDTVSFKVKTAATSYQLNIYRLGYYGGLGARKVASVQRTTAQTQPACLTNATVGLIDCGNWAVSLTWAIPTDAVSGIYIGKLVRTDTGGASHIVFIVRDDTSTSPLLFQASDTTWQAYNMYGGTSLYRDNTFHLAAGRGFKVSYNRPFITRTGIDGTLSQDSSWLFDSEHPMIRFLEANGYNVSYFTGADANRRGNLLLNHKIFLSVGHDEYWSGQQRANVEAARAAGVNLAFFSGNEVFWKTRWENSTDGSNTPNRTLVSYKETHANQVIDPADPPTWTGTWRDPRFSPPADGGRPENALTGTIFTVNGPRNDTITVPAQYGAMRFWRNTNIATMAPGTTTSLTAGTLGHEWDEDLDNGFRPAGLLRLSSTTLAVSSYIQDYGSTYANGTATHSLTLYRHPSGPLIFSSGTIRWSWGLDGTHDNGPTTPDVRQQQAMINLFADMGVQPSTLIAGLVPTTASNDTLAPTSTITAPQNGAVVQGTGTPVTISGTAADAGGGTVGAVEVSTDGGTTWHRATGTQNWTYTWTPSAIGSAGIESRAVDDSLNMETPRPGVSVTVSSATVAFDDLANPNRFLNGQYPTGEIDWGTNQWWLSSPWGKFTTQSISYPNGIVNSQSFSFLKPRRLLSIQAFNGGTGATTVTISCTGQTPKSQSVAANTVATIATSWTGTCSPATITSSNGWDTNFDNFAYDTGVPDTTPPIISNTQASGVSSVGATITWTTNEPADSQVDYGTTAAYGTTTTLDPALVLNHSVQLTGLTSSTLYHYRVRSKDGAVPPNQATSADSTFTTNTPDTTPPTLTNVLSASITNNAATITWTTNEAADSQVEYGLSTAYGSSTSLNTTLVTSHSALISGLSSSTQYHYRVKSKDAVGNLATSGDFTFATTAPPPPVTVTFDDLASPNRPLNGPYPTGVIDWGTGVWWLSSAWGLFTSQSISFPTAGQTSGTLSFTGTARRIIKIDAYNGGTASSTITLACSGQTTKSQAVAAGQQATITTGWTGTCTGPVTITSSNGWDTNFDNLVYDSGP